MHRLPVIALALFLSTAWGSAIVRATAAALGLDAPAAEQPAPPPTTESGASMDPLG